MAVENCSTKLCTKCGEVKTPHDFPTCSANKDGRKNICKVCCSADRAAYYAKNIQREKAQVFVYQSQRREELRLKRSAYYYAALEENRMRMRERARSNPELRAARFKAWYAQNKDYYRSYVANRKAKKRGNGGKHTHLEVRALYESQGGLCVYCRADLRTGYHEDHIYPISKGGSDDISNIQLLCPRCNLSKNNQLPEEFEKRIKNEAFFRRRA